MTDEERTTNRRMWLVIGGIALIVLLVAAVIGYRNFSTRARANRQLDEAIALIEDSDEIIVSIDEVVSAKITPELASQARGASERVPAARDLLDEASAKVEAASADLSPGDRKKAAAIDDAIDARKEMMERAPEILDTNAEAASALPIAEEGWTAMLAGDDLSTKAVKEYNRLTKAGVSRSRSFNQQAATKFTDARRQFVSADDAFPDAPFEDYIAYLDTRLRINRISRQTDAAWLAGDLERANTLIESFNKEDPKAVEQFKRLPASPAAAVSAAYEKATGEATKAYYAARDDAVAADDRVTAY